MSHRSRYFSLFIDGLGQGKHAKDVIPLPFFIGDWGTKVNRNGVYQVVTEAAKRVGLHNPCSDQIEDHFSQHCCKHWFMTLLRRAGMSREFIQELRGDVRREAIDVYDHIDKRS